MPEKMRHWSLDLHCFKFLTRREERPGLPAATDSRPINTTNSILGIPGVLHLHESKSWWSSGNPNVSNRAVLGEGVLEIIPESFHHDQLNLEMSTISFVLPVGVISKSSNVDLAIHIPVTVSHFR